MIKRLRQWYNRHFLALFLTALGSVVLFAPHQGDVAGWIMKWLGVAVIMGGLVLAGLLAFALLAGAIGRLLR